METNNLILISTEKDDKNSIKTIPTNPEETPIYNKYLNFNQRVCQTSESHNQKNFSVIPIGQTYNLRYASNSNAYDNLNDNIKDIINNPKYNSENRSKSAYSKKTFREKFESMKLKVPEIKKWNCDPTAEIIIHNLEQKIDILTYENFLLSKQIKELVSNNKGLQLDLNQKILLLKTEQQINDELKMSQNRDDINEKKNSNKNKNKDKDIDLYNENTLLKSENLKIKSNNENLANNINDLNKIIEKLKSEMRLNASKFEEQLENNKIEYENQIAKLEEQNKNNKMFFEKKLSEENEKYKILLEKKISEKNNKELNKNIINNSDYLDDNNINNINNNNNTNNNNDDNLFNNFNEKSGNNIDFDMNKYPLNEDQYKKLLEENENLHKQLRELLCIDDEEDTNINKNSISFPDNTQHFIFTPIKVNNNDNDGFNTIKNKEQNKTDITYNNLQVEEIIKENHLLKEKVKSLSTELNKVLYDHNKKLLKIQQKFNEYELKNKALLTKENTINNENNLIDNQKEEELDQILNETLLMNINSEDEETKKMISTVQNINDNQKKRISQCLIINNKLKALSEQNYLLQNQIASIKKEKNEKNLLNMNHSLNNSHNLNLNNMNNPHFSPHLCYCQSGTHESYDYLINALKIKDQIIIKYKEQNEENENKYKNLIIENSKLKERNSNSNYFDSIHHHNDNENNKKQDNGNAHYIKKDVKFNNLRRDRNAGLEDYLLGKIVNNQKEVLGDRAPRFDDNNFEFMSKSVQYQDNNKMNYRYNNNYHYREKRMTNY